MFNWDCVHSGEKERIEVTDPALKREACESMSLRD